MAPTNSADPVDALLRGDVLTRAHLHALVSRISRRPDDSALQAAIAWLDGPAQAQRHILENRVFPALVESMAGSDAVCLRGLTTRLAHERDELDRCWRATIRPRITAGTPDNQNTKTWAAAFEAYLQRTDDELLPMVPRLFDDEALDALTRACEDSLSPANIVSDRYRIWTE